MKVKTCPNGFLAVTDGSQTFYVQGMQDYCRPGRTLDANASRPSCTCPDGFSHPFWCAHKHFAEGFVRGFHNERGERIYRKGVDTGFQTR